MASTAITERPHGAGEMLARLVAENGSIVHPYAAGHASQTRETASRDLADIVHLVCMLHGRYPGVVELAAQRATDPAARAWINQCARGFAAERGFLARLVVAAGPVPSTLGQAKSEAAVNAQMHALATLARSERNGCALGAALALVLDWRTIRAILDRAAQRFGIQPMPLDLPGLEDAVAVADTAAATPATERALGFGAEQLLVQHRGLWDLLETRESARRG